MKTTHITAIFNPQPDKQYPIKLSHLRKERYRFREVDPHGKLRMFYADDPNFPHSLLCSENDLKEIEDVETK